MCGTYIYMRVGMCEKAYAARSEMPENIEVQSAFPTGIEVNE